MEKTPVVRILRQMSPQMLQALDKFMASPYHVTHADTVLLYTYIREQLSAAADAGLEKTAIARALQVPPRRLYHLNSYLLNAVEQFLALETWKQQPEDAHIHTVRALRRLQLGRLSIGRVRYTRKKLQAASYRGAGFHRMDYSLHLEAYHLSQQQGRAKDLNLQELSEAHDIAFISEKLRIGCMLLSHQAVSKREYDPGLLEPTLEFLDGHPYLDIPAVAAYYHGYFAQLGGDDSDRHFRQLKALLVAHADRFALAEVHDLYLMAVNFCIRRINRADSDYFRDVFDLYRSGLENGAFLENGELSRWTYTNIALAALKLREYDWAYRFLQDYSPLVPENHREGALNFNLARYFYDTGKYSEAMQHLVRMEYDDVLQNLMAKTMLCKIYYELGEYDALENQLDSIGIYLRRKKVLGYHKSNYTLIVRLMRRLLAVNPDDKTAVAGLLRRINAVPALTEREWFLKQLPELR